MTAFRCFLLAFAGHLACHAAFPTLHLKPVCLQQIHAPTNIVNAGDGSGRLFICDQPGRIYILKGGMLLPTPFLDITDRAIGQSTGYSERGLLGLAFHPGFGDPASPGHRKFYVYYSKAYQAGTDPAPPEGGDPANHTAVLAEFQASSLDADVADPASERRLLLFTQPQSNHNGGQLEFDSAGYLYFGIGDGGGQNDNDAGHSGGSGSKPAGALGNSQDRTRLYGKILRIDPLGGNGPDGQYGIPEDNPFVGAGGGIREEIYAFGLRNPWRFSFDKRPGGTGRLFCCDVGQNKVEEINLITSGGNYGWRIMEGSLNHDATAPNPSGIPLTGPIAEYAHPGATGVGGMPQLGLSGTGGYVYRGSAIPAMVGKYVFGDYGGTNGLGSGRLMGLEETTPNAFTLTTALPLVGLNPTAMRILCLGEDESGELYVGGKLTGGVLALDNGLPNGGIYKIVPGVTPTTVVLSAAKDTSIYSELGPSDEELSNAKGDLFSGRIANGSGFLRRALLAFDFDTLPRHAAITSATLQLTVNLVASGNVSSYNMTLHKLNESWGEGTSNGIGTGGAATTNDATWLRRLWPDTSWSTPGGSFVSAASATRSVGGPASYTWSSGQLAMDVQGWVLASPWNQGWLLRGDEATDASAKRIDSRESLTPSARPRLTLAYVPPSRFESWLNTYHPQRPVGGFVDPRGDPDGDGIPNQVEYAYALSPAAFDADSGFATTLAPAGGGARDFTTTFRRDSAATDLTYNLQVSSDLFLWTTIASSTAGGAPAGENGGVVEADTVIAGTVRLVTVRQNLPPGPPNRNFVRLQILRQP